MPSDYLGNASFLRSLSDGLTPDPAMTVAEWTMQELSEMGSPNDLTDTVASTCVNQTVQKWGGLPSG